MIRQAVIALIVFAAPFAAYALYRISAQRQNGEVDDGIWENAPIFWLSLAGVVFVIAALVLVSIYGQSGIDYVVPIYAPED